MEVHSIIFPNSVYGLSILKSLIVDLENSNWYQIEALDQIYTQMFENFVVIHKQKSEMLKSLKIGLETFNLYQINGLRELISKILKILGSVIS